MGEALSAPLVSVVMPVRNGGRPLIASIESILAQSLVNLEFIIVDDGSTDETAEILSEYQRLDPRVVILSQQPTGISPSLNRGFAAARGEFIARQDADDTSHVLRLAEQVRYMDRNPICALCCSWVRFVDESGEGYLSFRPASKDHLIKRDFERGLNPIVHGSVMIRRSALKPLSRVYRGRHGEDLDLWLRCMSLGDFGTVSRELYFYRINATGLSLSNLAAQRSLRDYIYSVHRKRKLGIDTTDDAYEQVVAKLLGDAESKMSSGEVTFAVQREIRDAVRAENPSRLAALATANAGRIPWGLRAFASLLANSETLRHAIRSIHDMGRGLVLTPVTNMNRSVPPPWVVLPGSVLVSMSEELVKVRDARVRKYPLPDVSVLMAVCDENPQFLIQAIESILTQTIEALELVIVDDGSVSAATRAILTRYSEITRRVKLVSAHKVGLTKALNIGLTHCTAPVIARQDSDDWSAPDRLEKQLNFLVQHPSCGIVGSFATICNARGEGLWVKRIRPAAFEMPALTKINPIAHGSLCFRRELLTKIGNYDERFEFAQDYELLVRAKHNTEIGLVREPLYFLRRHPSARSALRFRAQRTFARAARTIKGRESILAGLQRPETSSGGGYLFGYEDFEFERGAMDVDLTLINSGFIASVRSATGLVIRFPLKVRAWARLARSMVFPFKPIRPYLFR